MVQPSLLLRLLQQKLQINPGFFMVNYGSTVNILFITVKSAPKLRFCGKKWRLNPWLPKKNTVSAWKISFVTVSDRKIVRIWQKKSRSHPYSCIFNWDRSESYRKSSWTVTRNTEKIKNLEIKKKLKILLTNGRTHDNISKACETEMISQAEN